MKNYTDITGQRFGRLVAIKPVGTDKDGKKLWLCKCDCGNEKTAKGKELRNGRIKSCGCMKKENFKGATRSKTVENKEYTLLRRKWRSMKHRCNNENDISYKNYGARGVKVCPEWQNFDAFYSWAMGAGYEEGLTLDRINHEGDYCPENCRWATYSEQNNNRRNNILVECCGETKTLTQWANLIGVCRTTLSNKMKKGKDVSEYISNKLNEKPL